ncbi:hypothetical protein CPB84DRAFT_1779598 [Gymnopilus junonius]|uniref:Mediator of RNA polymerase II transcription subunit 25 n=1 Tax=Gymnopilus junonius TaxID=109634 RepID=A0A9P5NM67_GYMJU|nr:hypothetical protein CPB84DRAFT_1779598 [Gymnopilus junonius]
MASEQQPETVAIAFLVESSLSVAHEWRGKVLEYATHVLKRLSETHPGCKVWPLLSFLLLSLPHPTQVRVAFVTYGFADTLPSPILCKRFFTDLPVVLKEMEDLSRLGIGMTADGGSRGMAALEGFVSVLELFDSLHTHLPASTEGAKIKPPVSHIVHVADSSPDTSSRPFWNDSTTLDHVDWDSLPTEIKKRNIQLSTVNLRPNLSRFPELYAAVVTGGSAPWFTVRSPHSLFLAPFASPPSKVSPSKRTSDPDRLPEPKRPRLQSNTESPKPSPQTATPQAQTNPPSLPVTQPIRPTPTITQVPSAGPNTPSIHEFINRVKLGMIHLKELEVRIAAAQAEGNSALHDSLKQDYNVKKTHHTKMTQTLNQQFIAARQAMQAQSGLSQSQGLVFPQRELVAPPFSLNNGTGSLSTGNLPSSNFSGSSDINNTTQMEHSRSLSETAFPSGSTPPNTSTSAAAVPTQMQKSTEQQKLRPSAVGNIQATSGISHQSISIRPDSSPSTAPGSSQGAQSEQSINVKKNVPVWNGFLIWNGQGPAGEPKEVRTQVIASSGNPSFCRADTWPQNMTLAPGGPQVSREELQGWMKRHQPGLCTFRVAPNAPDYKTHESHYVSFVQLLTMKGIYATAAWPTPKGPQTKNALIFPIGTGLAGVFFPLTGLPELPKPAIPPATSLNTHPSMVAQMQNLNNLSQQQREILMAQLHQFRQAQAAVSRVFGFSYQDWA